MTKLTKNKITSDPRKLKDTEGLTKANHVPSNAIVREQLYDLYRSMATSPALAGVKFVYIPDLLGNVITTYAILRLPATEGTGRSDHKWLVAVSKCDAQDAPSKEKGKAIAFGRLRSRVEGILSARSDYIRVSDIREDVKKWVYNRAQLTQIYIRRTQKLIKIDWLKTKMAGLKRIMGSKKFRMVVRSLNDTIFRSNE